MADKEKNYLNMFGSMTHCWKIHRRKMQQSGQPRVTYATFRHRIVNLRRPLYQAIHTPARIKNRDYDRRRKVRFYEFKHKVEIFFRKLFNLGWSEKK